MDYQPGQPTEEEVAAGLAAVLAFMETQEVDKAKSNSWKQASYLESTLGTSRLTVRQATVKGSLWNIASRLAPLALVFWLSVMPAWSQELRPPLPEPNVASEPSSFSEPGIVTLSPSHRQETSSQFDTATQGRLREESRNSRREILRFAQNDGHLLRVGLLIGGDKLDLNTPDGADIIDQATGEVVGSSGAGQKFVVASKRGTLSVAVADATAPSAFKPVSYTPNASPQAIDKGWHGVLLGLAGQSGYVVAPRSADGLLGVNGKLYRGQLLLTPNRNSRDKLNVINLVDLEDYLLSVLPSEMPSLWHPEALKAQAIAARSYAMANLGKHAADGYDVKATSEDQVYAGVGQETDTGNLAVAQTQGIVLKQCGKVITAYFHSGGGGHTEAPESVWGGSRSYLQSVPDFDDASPMFSWSQNASIGALEETLRKSGVDVGQLLNIEILSRSDAMRVQKMMIAGSKAVRVVSGEQFRHFLTLPSTKFNIGFDADRYVFAGRGYGHGLGLSQWGAKTLAENGYNAPQILKYYYRDVMLDYI